jgi:membrane peptidoglycan carboxypeptidase
MADSPRQPGSSFKPFNYVYAFQHGLSPGTSVLDGPIAIPDTGNPEDGGWYEPTDYDHTFHGVVSLRTALDNSLNVPAVRVEQYNASLNNGNVRVVANQAVKMGIKSFWSDNPNCCGWALTLGGMERGVRLVEETAAYGAFATEGMTVPPTAIVKVYDRSTHKLLYDAAKDGSKPQRAVPAAYAYIMDNVLSDNASRCTPIVCEFGLDSPLYLGRTVAAKTGTTNSFTDNWTVGFTPDIVTGVWVGNPDNSPMVDSTGITGAAPIWHDFMLYAFDHYKLLPKDFVQPPGVYSGSECRLPGPYFATSSMSYDIYAGVIPLCSVGQASSSYLPPQAQTSPYQAPTAAVQPQVAPPTVQPAPAVATPTPVPAAPPPTAAAAPPVQAAPTQSIPGVQSGNVPPVQAPTVAPPAQSPPTQSPPAQSPPAQSPPSQTTPGGTPP